ncbi:MAG: hypothetical protein OHK0046_41410 [Anaerolineae bacterium]
MHRRLFFKRWFCFVLLLVFPLITVSAQPEAGEPGLLTNKLNIYDGADPWLQYHDGYYYLATTTWRSELIMMRSPTLAGLKTATPVQIYEETDPSRCCNMWAPEFYLLEGPNGPRWYYYYSAGTSGTLDNQRTHVLESEGTDPMGPYHYIGRVYDPVNDVWAIDGSILQVEGALYFLFSSWVGAYQSLFIAPMSNPWTISGPRVMLSQPLLPWEQMGGNVNEAPAALYHGDDVFITYSASSCNTPDYKLGMLTYLGDDPLDPAAWQKSPEPVFQRSDANGVYGPAHNGFFTSPDGSEHWIVYHANDTTTEGCGNTRTTRVQPFTWNEDGTPNFGEPVSPETQIRAPAGDDGADPLPLIDTLPLSRFRVYSYETGYLRHTRLIARIDVSPSPVEDSQFWVVSGLADPSGVSIRSANMLGYFLRHENNALVFAPDDGTPEFAESATWWPREGLADPDWVSFESYNRAGYYISQRFGVVALVENNDAMTPLMREDGTFFEER